jgi:pimeloyl-ACP methyl ester carboxylesterase
VGDPEGKIMISLLAPAGRLWGGTIARRLYHPPRRTHHRTPADVGLEYSGVRVRTTDGIELDFWVMLGSGTGCAVVGHGIGLSKSASIAQAAILHHLGLTVVMFDHRNHGLSATDPARTGLADRFTVDVRTAVRYARDLVGKAGITLVWGFSFSCFPSLYLLREPDNGVDALICDSGPAVSLRPLFDGFFDTGILPIPPGLRSGRGRSAMVEQAVRNGTSMLGAQWPPAAELGSLDRTPMLLLGGAQDAIVPVTEMQAIAALYRRARFVEVAGGHLEAAKRDEHNYRRLVEDFVGEVTGGSGRTTDPTDTPQSTTRPPVTTTKGSGR